MKCLAGCPFSSTSKRYERTVCCWSKPRYLTSIAFILSGPRSHAGGQELNFVVWFDRGRAFRLVFWSGVRLDIICRAPAILFSLSPLGCLIPLSLQTSHFFLAFLECL